MIINHPKNSIVLADYKYPILIRPSYYNHSTLKIYKTYNDLIQENNINFDYTTFFREETNFSITLIDSFSGKTLNIEDYQYFYVINNKQYYTSVVDREHNIVIWTKGLVLKEYFNNVKFYAFSIIKKPPKRHRVTISLKKVIEEYNIKKDTITNIDYINLLSVILNKIAAPYHTNDIMMFFKNKELLFDENDEYKCSNKLYIRYKKVIDNILEDSKYLYIRVLYTSQLYYKYRTESGLMSYIKLNFLKFKQR